MKITKEMQIESFDIPLIFALQNDKKYIHCDIVLTLSEYEYLCNFLRENVGKRRNRTISRALRIILRSYIDQ